MIEHVKENASPYKPVYEVHRRVGVLRDVVRVPDGHAHALGALNHLDPDRIEGGQVFG